MIGLTLEELKKLAHALKDTCDEAADVVHHALGRVDIFIDGLQDWLVPWVFRCIYCNWWKDPKDRSTRYSKACASCMKIGAEDEHEE
jgi:hypothetical protein